MSLFPLLGNTCFSCSAIRFPHSEQKPWLPAIWVSTFYCLYMKTRTLIIASAAVCQWSRYPWHRNGSITTLTLEWLMLCDGAFSGWLMKRMGRTRDGEIERASRGGADRDGLFQRFFKTTRGDRWWHCVSFIIGDPCSINAGERRTQSKAQGYGTKYHPDIAHTHNFTLPVTP